MTGEGPLVTLGRRPSTPLAELLATRAVPASLWSREEGTIRCTACAHRCVLGDGRAGACGVRFGTRDGVVAPFGYVARKYVREVELNTVFHVAPGARALTFGMYGCDLRCGYCQNWRISQALRDGLDGAILEVTPAALVDEAISAGARVICAAYNEPMIAAEWVVAVFTEARARGLVTVVVSDANTTPEALAFIAPVTDVFRVDLKGWSVEQYRTLGARPTPPLEAIAEARRLGMWVEVVTLVVPGFNDDPRGLRAIARHLASVDRDLPWHLNAFQPRYRMKERPPASAGLLVEAAGVAYARGLRYVYVGNLPGTATALETTRCPSCAAALVERRSYRVTANRLVDGRCPHCSAAVPGRW